MRTIIPPNSSVSLASISLGHEAVRTAAETSGDVHGYKSLPESLMRSAERRFKPSTKHVRIHPFRTKEVGGAACALAAVWYHLAKPDVRGATITNACSTGDVLAQINGFYPPTQNDIRLAIQHPLLYWQRLSPEARWLTHLLFDGLVPQAQFPGEIFSADFTFLPLSHRRYPFVFLPVMDLYTRYIVAWMALFRHPRASDFLMILDVLADAGFLPSRARTDNGRAFCARSVEARFVWYGIHHDRIAPRVPQWNGGMEAFNKYFKSHFLPPHLSRHDGTKILTGGVISYHATPRDCIGTTPAALAAGIFPEPIQIEVS